MVKFVRIYENNEYILLPLQDYLQDNSTQLPEGWIKVNDWINKVFEIKSDMEYQSLLDEFQVEDVDIRKSKESYTNLKSKYNNFDDDILMFISFLLGTTYFSRIGNPTIEEWLNAVDINHPFKKEEDLGYGYSFFDASRYEFGQNIIRKKLLSTLHWISSQGGA